jgi:hypothetical protein
MDASVCLLRQRHEAVVETLTIQDLASACRIFMGLSYPGGADSIPADRRPYFNISANAPIADFLPTGIFSTGVCQDLSRVHGGMPAYEFRLGSTLHPHLKLRIQLLHFHERDVWIFSVDTHDRCAIQAIKHLNAEEAEAWRILAEGNTSLKQQIEEAFASAGYMTPTTLLKIDLTDD